MALSADEKRRAGMWFVTHAFKKPRKVATTHVGEITANLDAVDDWFEAAPTVGPASNQASVVAGMTAAFKSATDASQKGLLVAAVALVRSGAI